MEQEIHTLFPTLREQHPFCSDVDQELQTHTWFLHLSFKTEFEFEFEFGLSIMHLCRFYRQINYKNNTVAVQVL